jgi:hypothetical protein
MEFILMMFVQAIFINGLHIAFKGYIDDEGKKHGNILFMIVSYRTYGKNYYWTKPLWDCIKCMASVWGTVSFGLLCYCFGWDVWNFAGVCAWLVDVIGLIYLSYFLYKLV